MKSDEHFKSASIHQRDWQLEDGRNSEEVNNRFYFILFFQIHLFSINCFLIKLKFCLHGFKKQRLIFYAWAYSFIIIPERPYVF